MRGAWARYKVIICTTTVLLAAAAAAGCCCSVSSSTDTKYGKVVGKVIVDHQVSTLLAVAVIPKVAAVTGVRVWNTSKVRGPAGADFVS